MPFANFDKVFAPAAAETRPIMPVLVGIHAGGYGSGSGAFDWTPLITNNNNSFIAVTLQYRVSNAIAPDAATQN